MALYKCLMTRTHRHSVTQSGLTALKPTVLGLLTPAPSLLTNSDLSLSSPQWCLFQDVTELKSHSM